jgi:cell division protein FtsA
MEDIVSYFFYAIRKSGYADKLGSGIVITGGTSLLPNLGQLIKFHTGYDVRVGKPYMNSFIPFKGVYDPRYSTVLGLLKLAADEDLYGGKRGKRRFRKIKSNEPGLFARMQMKIKQGVIEFFEEVPADTEM